MKSYFNEINFPKINSILRAFLFWVLFIFLLFLSGSQLRGFFPSNLSDLSYGIFGTVSAIISTWIFLKFEKRSFRDIGLVWESKTIYRFFIGLVLGTILFSLIILLLLGFTDLQLRRNNNEIGMQHLAIYLPIIPLALMEEIAFRSYPLLKLNRAVGLRLTQWIVAIAFALYHILNGWDPKIAFLGPGTWAFIFGLAAVWSRGIAVPTGIHVALNLCQSLLGMKGDNWSLWTLKHTMWIWKDNDEAAVATAMAKTDTVGVIAQLLVLLVGILMTEYYIRKRVSKTDL